MGTREELKQTINKGNHLVKEIKDIVEILSEWELNLTDIIANEEQLKDRCLELQDTMKDVIRLRQWLDFEESNPLNTIF